MASTPPSSAAALDLPSLLLTRTLLTIVTLLFVGFVGATSSSPTGTGHDASGRSSTSMSQFLSAHEMSDETFSHVPLSRLDAERDSGGDSYERSGVLELYVNCQTGNDERNDGRSSSEPVETLAHALELLNQQLDPHNELTNKRRRQRTDTIHVAGGICTLGDDPVTISRPVQIVGDGTTALSGGTVIQSSRWKPSTELTHHKTHPFPIYVADVADISVEEIKMLRLGPKALRRGRWPKPVGNGLTAPNFMFTTDWTEGPSPDSTVLIDGRQLQYLGLDSTRLPPGVAANLTTNASLYSSSLVHVLGSGERDVNSQLVRIVSATSDMGDEYIQLEVPFRSTLTPQQRYYFVNVDWGELVEGEYYHDIGGGKVYVCPPSNLVDMLLTEGVYAATLDRILEIVHTSDVVVSNLTFLDTSFYSDGYWDGPALEPSDAAIRINYCANVTVEACNFLESVGGYGVAIGNGTVNSSVTGCLFDSMGLGGVALYGYDAELVDCPPPVAPLPERDPKEKAKDTEESDSPDAALITTDKINYEESEDIIISFTNPGGNVDDWIGIYPAGVEEDGTVPRPSTEWAYSCGTQSCEGTTTVGGVTFANLKPGVYQAFIIMNVPPPYSTVQASEPFAVVGTVSCPFAVNNTKPCLIDVGYNIMSDLGRNLVHVAGVALRAASHCHIHHNRISHATRYGLQADSFYLGSSAGDAGMNTRFNIFEYNVLTDTCRTTTDTGAIEMLGSGDPGTDGGGAGWYTANTVRYNNISETVGSSSSDGEHVCVHGEPAGYWCRGLVWGIYLDGGQSGVTIYGNIIGATLQGAIFDNVGGNNTHENNILVGEAGVSSVLLDFGEPGTSASHPVERSISGSIVRRNIFYSRSNNSATAMVASQAGPFLPELKKNGSDYNLFWSPAFNLSSATVFPGGADLLTWQGKIEEDPGPVTCSNTFGKAGRFVMSSKCDWRWEYNSTDLKLRSHANEVKRYAITLDCDDDWYGCSYSNARICLDTPSKESWATDLEWLEVDNQGWLLNASDDGSIMPVASNQSCLEVCREFGKVKGCDGDEGSVVQLRDCTGEENQIFDLHDDGTLRSVLNGGNLCVSPPARIPRERMDLNSLVADPLFADPNGGNFDIPLESPAFKLGFRPIPKIEPPLSVCGLDTNTSCLAAFLEQVALVSYTKTSFWNVGRSLWLRIGCSVAVLILGVFACVVRCRTNKGIYGVLSAGEEA